ncbi:ribonuclease H-like domain-containing protein, partial [Tanacetum coccineum]
LVVENPTTANEAWEILASIFNDNKRSHSIALKPELCSMKLEDLSIDAYFRKTKSIATILSSLGSTISNDDVVNIALDGLSDRYQHVSDIIIHRDPFSDLKTVRSMLTTAEMRLKSRAQVAHVDSISSSPMIFLANSGSNTRRSPPSTEKVNKPCFNFNKDSCRFGEYCKFLHNGVHGNPPSLSSRGSSSTINSTSNLTQNEITTLQGLLAKMGTIRNSTGLGNTPVPNNTGLSNPVAYNTNHQGLIQSNGTIHGPLVEFDAFGFSVNDFLTRRQQHLGHPGSEVLRRVLSSNSISCNKGKLPVLFHACQLGKHVKLLFVNSSTVVRSCFDIVYSDLWTSPIPSLSDGFSVCLMTPTSSLSYDFLDEVPNVISNYICLSPNNIPPITVQTTNTDPPIPPPTGPNLSSTGPTTDLIPHSQNEDPTPDRQNDDNTDTIPHNPTMAIAEPITSGPSHTNRFTLHVSYDSPLPKWYRDAFNDPNWQNAMSDEYNALIKNNTWTLMPRPMDANIIEGVDVDDTFSLIVKPSTIQKVLSLAISQHWPVHQLDVKNAFLHGDFSETVYMHQLPGFRDSAYPDYVCLLHQSLYGLNKGPLGLVLAFCCLYYTDLGSLNYFLGISITRDSFGIFLSQRKYAVEILERAHMTNCNPSQTPVDTESKLRDDGDPVSDPTLYRTIAGSLQYLTCMLAVHWIMGYSYFPHLLHHWLLIRMRIGLAALLLSDRPLVIVYFLATTYSLGPLSGNQCFLDRVLKQSSVAFPMLLMRLVG